MVWSDFPMTPAQLISTSMAPWSPSTAARWTLPASVTSISTRLSLPSMSGIRRCSACAESGFRQPARTRQPSTAYCRANSSPIPRFAPVTSTVFIAAAPHGCRSRIRLSIRRRSRAAGDGRPGEAPATLGELETPGRRERLRSFRAPALVIVSPERGIAPVGDLRRSSVQYAPAVHGGPMSVEPIETMSEAWAKWEGRLIGAFPLRRYLGCSDHSGVFLTEIEGREPSQVALKVVPALATLVESQLSNWNDAANLSHPHLVRLLGTGRFQLDGPPHLYVVMELADQNLAQLLTQRALTEDEAREMLRSTLSALTFLHDRNLVHRQLKPANMLAVGDQLKLASDTICHFGDAGARRGAASVYDPPEARDGIHSPAGDIWALGVSLFEALTRRRPPGLDEGREGVVLPHEFSPTLRDIVARCLQLRPEDRPKVPELDAWIRGKPPGPAPVQPARPAARPQPTPPPAAPTQVPRASAVPGPKIPQPIPRAAAPISAAPHTAAPKRAAPEAAVPRSRPAVQTVQSAQRPAVKAVVREGAAAERFWRRLVIPGRRKVLERWVVPQRFVVPLGIAAAALLALSWVGLRALRPHRTPTPPSVQAHQDAPAQTRSEAPPVAARSPAALPGSSGVITRSAPAGGGASPSGVHEEIPDVPPRARHTIRGHIRVSVRVMVDQDGTVFAALVDQPGPSRYFRRLAIEAAKKWTFPPADRADTPQRLELVRFVFSRQGTTAHAVALK